MQPHLERLSGSAVELGYSFNKESTTQAIDELIKKQRPGLYKLRIKLKQSVAASYDIEPYSRFQDPNSIIKIKILNPSRYHSNSKDPLCRHKTNRREDFGDQLQDCDEVIWLNERSEVAEGSYTNIFWQNPDNSWHTPSLETGILPGTMRAQMLSSLRESQRQSNPNTAAWGSLRFAQDDTTMTNIQEGFYDAQLLKNAKKIIITNAMLGPREATIIN